MVDWQISISAVLGALLTLLIAHRLTLSREKQNQYNKVVTEFKNLFIPFLQKLENPNANPEILVVQNYPTHEEEARKLVNILSKRKELKFKQKWYEYNLLFRHNLSLGNVALTASIVEDLTRAHEPGYIQSQNTKRRKEVISIIQNILSSL